MEQLWWYQSQQTSQQPTISTIHLLSHFRSHYWNFAAQSISERATESHGCKRTHTWRTSFLSRQPCQPFQSTPANTIYRGFKWCRMVNMGSIELIEVPFSALKNHNVQHVPGSTLSCGTGDVRIKLNVNEIMKSKWLKLEDLRCLAILGAEPWSHELRLIHVQKSRTGFVSSDAATVNRALKSAKVLNSKFDPIRTVRTAKSFGYKGANGTHICHVECRIT